MVWKKISGMIYEDCEEETVKGVTDGINSRDGKYIDKPCRLR